MYCDYLALLGKEKKAKRNIKIKGRKKLRHCKEAADSFIF
jgi:hypothetical protein